MKRCDFDPKLAVMMVSLALSACVMIPKYQQPEVNVPERYQYDTTEQTGIRSVALGWQDYFADPRLYRLIELVLKNNTDLRAAALNAEAIRKQYMISRASLLLGINVSGNGSRGRIAQDLSGAGNSFLSSS